MAISEIVKYDNKLNMISFKELNKLDSDVFFSILARLKEKGTEKVTLSFAELTEYMPKNISSKEILAILDTSTNKLASSIIRYETQSKISKFAIFQLFEIDRDNFYITAQISEPFLFLLNNLETGFTAFELAEFSNLTSKYTQTLYRLLKQFKKTGYRVMEWGEFLEIMNVPKSYSMGDIDKRVLNPSVKELSQEPSLFEPNNPIFKKLAYKKIRGKGRGRPVEKIEFYFMPETNEPPKEQKKNEKALQYIAQDIKKEQMLKELKRSSQEQPKKIDPFTGKEITGLEPYRLRNMRFKNQFGEYDILKIQSIEQEPSGKIIVSLRNVDDNHISTMKFDSLKHFENTFNLHQI